MGKKKSPPKRLSKNSNKSPKLEEESDIYGQTEEKDFSSEEDDDEEDKEEESPPRQLRRSSRRSSEKLSLKNLTRKKDKRKFGIQKGRSKRVEETYDSYDDTDEDQDS